MNLSELNFENSTKLISESTESSSTSKVLSNEPFKVLKLPINTSSIYNLFKNELINTPEEWKTWFRNLSIGLLQQSSSPALRALTILSRDQKQISNELFNYSFHSIYQELNELIIINSFEKVLNSLNVPIEILQSILNLIEYMEQVDIPINLPTSLISRVSEECHMYAKALRYKEQEFKINHSKENIQSLISLNQALLKTDAAIGILEVTKEVEMASAYEKLGRWEDALRVYEKSDSENSRELMIKKMRCLKALNKWEKLSKLVDNNINDPEFCLFGARSCWNLGNIKQMEKYLENSNDSIEANFLRSIMFIIKKDFEKATNIINKTEFQIAEKIYSVIHESYSRAYEMIVTVHQLNEMREILKINLENKNFYLNLWKKRLLNCQESIDVWQDILSIHHISLPRDIDLNIIFAKIAEKGENLYLTEKILLNLINDTGGKEDFLKANPKVVLSYLRFLWNKGKQEIALKSLEKLVTMYTNCESRLLARINIQLGDWIVSLSSKYHHIQKAIKYYKEATKIDSEWHTVWRKWGMSNYAAVSHLELTNQQLIDHLIFAVKGFFKSLELHNSAISIQDTLRVLTIWFKYGNKPELINIITKDIERVPLETWLPVIPQIIARLHTKYQLVRKSLVNLLHQIGNKHPQSLVFPINVAKRRDFIEPEEIIIQMKVHSNKLVNEAEIVSRELIRITNLWRERWMEGIEDASRLYIKGDLDQMIKILIPLHKMINIEPSTLEEELFLKFVGFYLKSAYSWLCRFFNNQDSLDCITKAWKKYYKVYKYLSNYKPSNLKLPNISPTLSKLRNISLSIPGTYPSLPLITISKFDKKIVVISSKQHPRKLRIYGSDGLIYKYLIKGNEDLRQDERVMQMFRLINTLLANHPRIMKQNLGITIYSVVPLSSNVGLIGWVSSCDPIHNLIKEYRQSNKIEINTEHKTLLFNHPKYELYSAMQKTEAFTENFNLFEGMDIANIMWSMSPNSELWLEKRTNFTRSVAVMSMVGYILGLGDRHPSNLMIQRLSGKLVHIDFGDCFDIAIERDNYPEQVPFRLTRMFTNAMGISGYEGDYRITSQNVMRILRKNQDTLNAILEAFLYDPLIEWRFEKQKLKGIKVIRKIHSKLTGLNELGSKKISIEKQVNNLINEAISHTNLSLMYYGWCPFW